MKYTRKNLILDSNPIMRQISEHVSFPLSTQDRQLIDGLYEYVTNSSSEELCEKYDLKPSLGIAAIQVGGLRRMCVVYMLDKYDNVVCDLKMINPFIIKREKISYLESGEGCLSVEEEHPGIVYRAFKIKVKYYDVYGRSHFISLEGFPAIAVQHEIDHLNGKFFYDHISIDDSEYINPNAIAVKRLREKKNSQE